jgi:tetratricopeptide (TPR) repeat protein
MPTITVRNRGLAIICLAFFGLIAPQSRSQDKSRNEYATVEGTVCDAQNHPIEDATIFLENGDHAYKLTSHSDSQGRYRFEDVPPGTYALRATRAGYQDAKDAPFLLRQGESRAIVLHLSLANVPTRGKDGPSTVEFSDETQFNVAGVTDPSNLGGHGSDSVLRTKESLAKETASLNDAGRSQPKNNPSASEDAANTHARLGDVAESEGRPLEAVREYQRAAELQPNEAHLFAWGADLLLHRAFEPAIVIFTRGHQLYPESVRMLLGLGAATYDQGATEQGEKILLQACDLNPSDPTPYLFLGKLQTSEKTAAPGWTERFERFTRLHPENALAHYYYAVTLGKQETVVQNSAQVESELKRAIELDPQLGEAYLQLGILYSERKDYPDAIAAFQKAIEITPLPDEAHYRLAQVYGHEGNAKKSAQEITLFKQVSEQKKNEAERERHKIQQFVYTLPSPSPATQQPASNPH